MEPSGLSHVPWLCDIVDRLYQKSDFVWGADGKMETVWVKDGHIADLAEVAVVFSRAGSDFSVLRIL